MIHETSTTAIAVFLVFLGLVLGLSFWLGRRAKSAGGFFAAHGQIHWFVNGIAFAGDYLSAASFLGICGMIAFYGYDGFLYSIGFLAGWIVALFVIGEPMKRLGKFTFADALDAKFHSRGVRFAAAVSTLVVSIFYLIPQMVGAGAIVQPLLGISFFWGVLIVGSLVIVIVVTAGMVSTTWVQFLKGSLLVIFCLYLVNALLRRYGGNEEVENRAATFEQRTSTLAATEGENAASALKSDNRFVEASSVRPTDIKGRYRDAPLISEIKLPSGEPAIRVQEISTGEIHYWKHFTLPREAGTLNWFQRLQTMTITKDGGKLANGKPFGKDEGQKQLLAEPQVTSITTPEQSTLGSVGVNPFDFLRLVSKSTLGVQRNVIVVEPDGAKTTIFESVPIGGNKFLSPGNSALFSGLHSGDLMKRLDFVSLMLALFCGTASLPHILIRYYTVKDAAAARKSTIVGLSAIGLFYILTLFIGVGAAMASCLDPGNNNLAAPLLARTFGEWPFAVISAIAFTTVLGTVSGLILAAAGAVAHDLVRVVTPRELGDVEKVRLAKVAAVVVGIIAMFLGVQFEKLNVSFLVGWAFNIAASANLPAIIMILFWKGTTKTGVVASIMIGMIASLGWILLSAQAYRDVYGLNPNDAPMPFSQPGLVTIPLSFATLVVVSLLTKNRNEK